MLENTASGEKRFVWNDVSDGLLLLGVPKRDNEQNKGRREKSKTSHKSKIYCPHAYLELIFNDTFDPGGKIKFRKHYLRKVAPTEANVVILQDVKDLVLYMLVNPVTVQFINFFHVPVVDRFLRASIIYFQYYIETWEDLTRKRAATARKTVNPLATRGRIRQADEMETLRTLLAREYADMLMGCGDTAPYHHMTAGRKSVADDSASQSQGEKDLRIFEVLIRMAHRVVWIALQRKHFSLIEVEMHRLFRTDAYNTADRKSGGVVNANVPEEEIRVLQGPKMPARRKLLRNSPLPYQIINRDCDFRVMSLGLLNVRTNDPRIQYLQNALLAEEETLPKLGIRVGILGLPRPDFDVMLMPSEGGDQPAEQDDEEERWERRKSSSMTETPELQKKIVDSHKLQEEHEKIRIPAYGPDPELTQVFPVDTIGMRCWGHHEAREAARKKWHARALKRYASMNE